VRSYSAHAISGKKKNSEVGIEFTLSAITRLPTADEGNVFDHSCRKTRGWKSEGGEEKGETRRAIHYGAFRWGKSRGGKEYSEPPLALQINEGKVKGGIGGRHFGGVCGKS